MTEKLINSFEQKKIVPEDQKEAKKLEEKETEESPTISGIDNLDRIKEKIKNKKAEVAKAKIKDLKS